MTFDLVASLQTLGGAFIGSGVAVVLLQSYLRRREKIEERQIQDLRDKLDKLYAPLFFFTSLNEECLSQCRKFMSALGAWTGNGKWVQTVQDLPSDEMEQAIGIENEYVRLVKENNDQIFSILRENWMFIDPDDLDVFRETILDHLRLKIETEPGGKYKTPYLAYKEMGAIPFMRPEFMERVKKKVMEKQARLGSFVAK